EPFDLAAVPDLNPAEMRLGGRGVYMMRNLMDQVSCQRRDEGGNVLHMEKRWPSGELRDTDDKLRGCGWAIPSQFLLAVSHPLGISRRREREPLFTRPNPRGSSEAHPSRPF